MPSHGCYDWTIAAQGKGLASRQLPNGFLHNCCIPYLQFYLFPKRIFGHSLTKRSVFFFSRETDCRNKPLGRIGSKVSRNTIGAPETAFWTIWSSLSICVYNFNPLSSCLNQSFDVKCPVGQLWILLTSTFLVSLLILLCREVCRNAKGDLEKATRLDQLEWLQRFVILSAMTLSAHEGTWSREG